MRRILAIVIPLPPAAALAYLTLQPEADLSFNAPIFHFYIVTFAAFAAAVISILLVAALGPETKPRHTLTASAFAVIGSLYFSHGLTTTNALIDHFHPAIAWSAWLAFLGSGAMFACAALDGPKETQKWLPVQSIIYATASGVVVYSAVAAFAPQVLSAIQTQVDPWGQKVIFYVTLALWMFASFRLWQVWRITHGRVDGMLALVAFWMITATVSLHLYPAWKLSWWLHHVLLPISFVSVVAVLAQQYEQVRQFRLRRYYLAASLILTVLLALVASALFTQFSYNTLVAQLQSSAAGVATNTATEIAASLPDIATADDLRLIANRSGIQNVFAMQVAGLPVKDIIIYDDTGLAVYAIEAEHIGEQADEPDEIERSLSGETFTEIKSPDSLPADYGPAKSYLIETYAPFYPGGKTDRPPIGVLVTEEEVPQLSQAIINARLVGLITAASTMGLLFIALLLVVSRADRIIVSRTEELTTAYTNLRAAEAMRDDLTNMIVHDLRNPLSAISMSLDFLSRTQGGGLAESLPRLVGTAQSAARHMMGMIEDLLAVSKMESGEFKLQRQETQLLDLLHGATQTFAAQAAAEKKDLDLHCPPELTVALDPLLIRRVLENLIGNALKYTDPNGKIQVLARAENGRVLVNVRDNGLGIPDRDKQRIFEKFVQLSGERDSMRKGVGLGLAFCQLAVRQHGGEIKVEDAPGGGSDFAFWVPRT